MDNKRTRYPQEVKERAARMVFEQTQEHGSQWAAIESISGKFGMTSRTQQNRRGRSWHPAGTKKGNDGLGSTFNSYKKN